MILVVKFEFFVDIISCLVGTWCG